MGLFFLHLSRQKLIIKSIKEYSGNRRASRKERKKQEKIEGILNGRKDRLMSGWMNEWVKG